LCVMMISQLILGLYLAVCAAVRGALPISPVPLPVYMMCVFTGPWFAQVAFPIMSLTYDLLAFSVIVYLVVRSNVNKAPISSLFKTIAQDATYYFLVIFTSHFVLVMFLAFAHWGLKLLPAPGTIVFLSVMVTRLLLSLKKAVATQERGWSFGEPSNMRFAERQGGLVTRDEIIHLDIFSSTYEGIHSRE